MNSAHFPINDLKRRKVQTSLTTLTLTLSVASTLFLLLLSNRLGVGIAAKATGLLTQGLTAIFTQFILFIGVLVFLVGTVLTSFIVFLMMAQRTRDFGLIKATGCPNSLVAGYFMTELLTITLIGCLLGIGLGFLADFAVSNTVFSSYTMPLFCFAPIVFVAFFLLAVFFGIQPLLKASKMAPIEALSPVSYYGLTIEKKHKPLSRRGITWRIASRSLGRRQAVSVRIVILLSIVFVLLTVSVGGGIIASSTTVSWVQKISGSDTIAIAHSSMGEQYTLLLSKFSGAQETGDFNYSDPNLAVPNTVIEQLASWTSVSLVDTRLVVAEHLQEVSNFTIDPDTAQTFYVGDNREGDGIVIGVNPQKLASEWSLKGRFLSENGDLEAVIGDSVSQSMFYGRASKYVAFSDPLLESVRFENTTFSIVGVCVDPLNNGQVVYVPIENLENATRLSNPNLLLVKLSDSIDRESTIAEIRSMVQAIDSDLDVFDLNNEVEQNMNFLSSTWQTIMLVPFFTLASAAMCLVGYMMLAVNEQRQEFGTLRAVGAKPRIIISVSAIQSAALLISSFAIGLSIGIVVTLIVLMANPLVTSTTIVMIGGLLAAALIIMFVLSIYPAFRLAKTSILQSLT